MCGKLIVFEGCDRCGKSTQAKLLENYLKSLGKNVILLNFPDRTTETGKIIDSYLSSKINISPQSIHLLFSANRWEKKELIENSDIVILDRYYYSGIAYSEAIGLDSEWCKNSDKGLPKPDVVFYMDSSIENIVKRSGFGNEKYEKIEFQKKVMENLKNLREDNWEIIDASESIENIHEGIKKKIYSII